VVDDRRVKEGINALERGFEEIYPVLRAKVFRFVRSRAGWLDCDEITDVAIERLWWRMCGPEAAVENIEAMAIAIAANALKDAIKKRRPLRTVEFVDVATEAGSWVAGDRDGRLALLAAIEKLEPDLKEVVKLVYLDEQSMVQAARVLGVGRGVVRRRLDRAFVKIRQTLTEPPPGQD
jgi:RNA polymerase sigma factor (sigma-70 family)